jgi:hypothetical protein
MSSSSYADALLVFDYYLTNSSTASSNANDSATCNTNNTTTSTKGAMIQSNISAIESAVSALTNNTTPTDTSPLYDFIQETAQLNFNNTYNAFFYIKVTTSSGMWANS